MQRLLAVLLVLIGLIGLVVGRLGETTWAPATEVTASVTLSDPGPAVVIDPGVLYVGGEEGTVRVTGSSDVSVITAPAGDVSAYLDGTKYTRITGASDWSTLSTETVNADGETTIEDPTSSDLWTSVDTSTSPATIDVATFAKQETGDNEQEYRPILLVTDGKAAGADEVSITWPVDAKNDWVPFAYAGGAAIAVIGLVLLVVSLGSSRRRDEEQDEEIGEAGTAGAVAGAAGPDTEDPDGHEPAGDDETEADAAEAADPAVAEDTAPLAPAGGAAAGTAPAATAPTAPTAPEAPASADDEDRWSVVAQDEPRPESPEEHR